MPLTRIGALVTGAAATGRGVGAYNAIGIAHAAAIAAGVEAAGLPAIIYVSENAVQFHGGRLAPLAAACAVLARSSSADHALHLDHVQSPERRDGRGRRGLPADPLGRPMRTSPMAATTQTPQPQIVRLATAGEGASPPWLP